MSRLNVKRVDFAYGDTVLDIPLLEHAEHPVAVYPDAKLKQIALEKIGKLSAIRRNTGNW
ncbi:MAG: hypothetical protein HC797_05695 [Anaerolineales bacterium]|nr:hypothetical protein [Anaerolineales bacterium]